MCKWSDVFWDSEAGDAILKWSFAMSTGALS